MSAVRPLKGVLLDIDGTLLDSNDSHALSWIDALREAGHEASFEMIRPMIGMGGDKLLPKAAGVDASSEAGRKLSERRWAIFREKYLAEVRAFPGARPLVDALRGRGLRLVVATSAKEEELRELLRAGKLEDLLEAKTSADDAEHSKPDPDIIHAALSLGKLRNDEAVLLGDTPYDIEAATRAGVPTVALRCGGWGDDELDGAVALYDGPADLVAKLDDSAFAR